jgi:hypothetical protein
MKVSSCGLFRNSATAFVCRNWGRETVSVRYAVIVPASPTHEAELLSLDYYHI